MENVINEKTYPIRTRYFLKSLVRFLFSIFFLGGLLLSSYLFSWGLFAGDGLENFNELGLYTLILLVITPFGFIGDLIYKLLARATFSYSFEEHFLVLHQGIITRSQRNIPWAVIQHVILKQDVLDKILGLGTVMVENAVQDQTAMMQQQGYNRVYGKQQANMENIGFLGNRVTIPGLKIADAQLLKAAILQKVHANIVHPSVTGL